MTGVIATLLAVGVIATLMLIGIRVKLPPPDFHWRNHLPAPTPLPPGLRRVWMARYAAIPLFMLCALMGWKAAFGFFFGIYVVLIGWQMGWAIRAARARRPRHRERATGLG